MAAAAVAAAAVAAAAADTTALVAARKRVDPAVYAGSWQWQLEHLLADSEAAGRPQANLGWDQPGRRQENS